MSNYYDETTMMDLWSRYSSLTKEEMKYFWGKNSQVISGVIFTHQFLKYGTPFDELQSAATEALLSALPRFNPEFVNKYGKKTTLFNYTSLVAKRGLIFYTLKQSQHLVKNLHENQSIEDMKIIHEPKQYSQVLPLLIETINKSRYKYKKTLLQIAQDFDTILCSYQAFTKRQLYFLLKQKYSPNKIRKLLGLFEGIKKELYSAVS